MQDYLIPLLPVTAIQSLPNGTSTVFALKFREAVSWKRIRCANCVVTVAIG